MVEVYQHPKLSDFLEHEGLTFDLVFIEEEAPFGIYGGINESDDDVEINLVPEKMKQLRNLIENAEFDDLITYE